MSVEHYHEYVKCREASFVTPWRQMKAFVAWLQAPSHITRNVLLLLGYLAWDRIGMIIECCVRLRELSRHARSTSAFTIYEVNKALALLEADPQTTTSHLRDAAFCGMLQQQLAEYRTRKYYNANQGNGKSGGNSSSSSVGNIPAATAASTASSSTFVMKSEAQSSSASSAAATASSDATSSAYASNLAAVAEATGIDPTHDSTMTAGILNPPEISPIIFSSSASSVGSSFALGSTSSAHPADSASLSSLSTAAGLTLPLVSSSPPSSLSMSPNPGRFTDQQRAKLHAMSVNCGWKYRRNNPEVIAIVQQEGLAYEQIRGWIANNKPKALKRPQHHNTSHPAF